MPPSIVAPYLSNRSNTVQLTGIYTAWRKKIWCDKLQITVLDYTDTCRIPITVKNKYLKKDILRWIFNDWEKTE